jgi:bifunctional ADP-heptose synthase (sugar kinase/adenylyltransferase)
MNKHPKETDRLKKIVESFPNITVTVLGDLVADEFIFGEISRVSREAPVLILKHKERNIVPGGGANAINNLADLGINVLPVGIVGDDDSAQWNSQGQNLLYDHQDPHSRWIAARLAAAGGSPRSRA